MDHDLVRQLARIARECQWEWKDPAFTQCFRQLELVEKSRSGQRRITYEFKNYSDATLSVYYYYDEHPRVEFAEVTVEISASPKGLNETELDDLMSGVEDTYQRGSALVEEVLGAPAVSASRGEPDFPSELDANHVSIWALENMHLMIQWKYEAADFPLRVVLAFERPDRWLDDQ